MSEKEFIKVHEAKAGTVVELDNRFDCHEPGEVVLQECFTGLYFECSMGCHYIDGQLENDHYVGMFKCE